MRQRDNLQENEESDPRQDCDFRQRSAPVLGRRKVNGSADWADCACPESRRLLRPKTGALRFEFDPLVTFVVHPTALSVTQSKHDEASSTVSRYAKPSALKFVMLVTMNRKMMAPG